jgi:hypothetical protein
MKDNLENFVQRHRSQFDDEAAPDWSKLEQVLWPEEKKKAGLIWRFKPRYYLGAAASILVAVFFIAKFNGGNKASKVTTVSNPVINTDTSNRINNDVLVQKPETAPTNLAKLNPSNNSTNNNETAAPKINIVPEDNSLQEEVYHIARLVQIRQKRVEGLLDQPQLYAKFKADMDYLNNSFNNLKQQLNKKTNKQELLEAMLLNVRAQERIIEQQLQIIKNIDNYKKNSNATQYNKT